MFSVVPASIRIQNNFLFTLHCFVSRGRLAPWPVWSHQLVRTHIKSFFLSLQSPHTSVNTSFGALLLLHINKHKFDCLYDSDMKINGAVETQKTP